MVLFMVVWVLTSVMPVFQLFFSADLGVTDTSRHFVSKINPFNYNKMLKLHKCSMDITQLGNEATLRKKTNQIFKLKRDGLGNNNVILIKAIVELYL